MIQGLRCINLDWLEVHVYEPPAVPMHADFYRSNGWVVEERDYGTRVYAEMFTLMGTDGHPLIEVRRNPKTPILMPNDVHLRLHNRTCYFDNAAELMAQFIERYNYTFVRIVRADICLDFERFDSGDDPNHFLRRYLSGRFSKLNQSTIHSHGTDTWSCREWHSVSWGSPTSDIGTKFYNKTLELYDPTSKQYRKPYIRQAWHECGLIDDFHTMTRTNAKGVTYVPAIWRLEFSIRSSVKNWFVVELHGENRHYQSIRNILECYDSRPKLLTLFASLTQHYFHFKYFKGDVRKDRCPDKFLFDFDAPQRVKDGIPMPIQYTYKIGRERVASAKVASRSLALLIEKLRNYSVYHTQQDIHDACQLIIKSIESEQVRMETNPILSQDELKALRFAISAKVKGCPDDAAVLINEIKNLLRINDNTLFI